MAEDAKKSRRSGNPAKRAAAEAEAGPDDAGASPLRGAETYAFKDLEPEEQSLPAWYMYTAVGMLLLGLVWICLYYLIPGGGPIQPAGGWNILIGGGIAMTGFFMLMRWK
ncbi:cell division protein CrgA [Nesterenkonia sp. NBAIMH1]|uniref:cell division protein CrgA n=1 Tax=Nesterenkonia sp. NBAIMH1 TaxID=2600320 RepID=UPI001FF07645|nr:cell division protein CrgA [Nesterenkonia sp. NBAIMH1]